jgi:hypothetical protein
MMDDALNKAYACFDAKKKKKKICGHSFLVSTTFLSIALKCIIAFNKVLNKIKY